MPLSSHQYKKYLLLVMILLLATSVYVAVVRDWHNLSQGYACDLRKRIVGARYQEANLSPYFFKWQPGYPATLANPYEVGPALPQNATTLPPSYLWILQPLAKLPFATIEKVWLCLQYIWWLTMVVLFATLAKTPQQRVGVATIGTVLLFTAGWVNNADIGQSYLIFPLIWTMAYAMGRYTHKPWLWTAIGLALSCWLRPVCGLMILPFLLMPQRKQFLQAFIPAAIVLIAQAWLTGQWHNWLDFFKSSLLWGKYYNSWGPAAYSQVGSNALPTVIEGQTDFSITALPDYLANLPMVVQNLTGRPLVSNIVYAILMVVGMSWLLWQVWKRRQQLSVEKLWVAGFLLYYWLEVMVAIPKPAYYIVELFFPLCLWALNWQQKGRVSQLLMLLGLLLSVLPVGIIPMNLLLGEYFLVLGIVSDWMKTINNG